MADQQQPMYRAYTIIDREKETPFWLNIGVAFVHKDTKGFNVILQALPLDGKLVLRQYTEEPQETKTEAPTSRTKKRPMSPQE